MWEYNYTGASDDPDSLMHWKYIKRYKKNGKWRYIYKTNQLKADIDRATGKYQKKKAQMATEERRDTEHRLKYATGRRSGAEHFFVKQNPDNSTKEERIEIATRLSKALDDERMYANKLEYQKKAEKIAWKNYESTPLYKLESAIDSGKSFIDKVLKK